MTDRLTDRQVRIDIGALELTGFSAGSRHRVAAAFERELGRLVRDRGVPRDLASQVRPSSERQIRVPRLRSSDPPELSGARIAYAVFRSLG